MRDIDFFDQIIRHLRWRTFVFFALIANIVNADSVSLTNGDQLTGKIIDQTKESVTFLHPVIGKISIAQSQITVIRANDLNETSQPEEGFSKNNNMQRQLAALHDATSDSYNSWRNDEMVSSNANRGKLLTPVTKNNLFKNIRFISGLSAGYSTFEFPAKLDHEIHFPSTEVLIAATKERWQLSLNWMTSLSNATVSEEEDIGIATRNDLDLTLGYQVNKNWSVFAGYKDGETEINFTSREDDIASRDIYAQRGPYIGSGYSWKFERAGSLNLSLAYAYLDATNNFRANTDDDDEEEALEFDDLTGTVTGISSGLSYAAAWTMPLSSNLLFQSKLKINDYQQDITHDNIEYEDINETFTRLSVGLAYVF